MATKSRFVVFEGVDGCGKSTQMARYAEHLRRQRTGRKIATTSEPYGSVGVLIREVLAGKHKALSGPDELARLFAASRSAHATEVIRPALEEDWTILLCDRYYPSSLVYQGCAPPFDPARAAYVQRLNADVPVPTITVVVDVTVQTALHRLAVMKGKVLETFDKEHRERHEARVHAYRTLAGYVGVGPVMYVNGEGTPDEVHTRLVDALDPFVL